MIAISETYNRTHNILEIIDFFPNVSFTESETEVIITNKNGRCELNDQSQKTTKTYENP